MNFVLHIIILHGFKFARCYDSSSSQNSKSRSSVSSNEFSEVEPICISSLPYLFDSEDEYYDKSVRGTESRDAPEKNIVQKSKTKSSKIANSIDEKPEKRSDAVTNQGKLPDRKLNARNFLKKANSGCKSYIHKLRKNFRKRQDKTIYNLRNLDFQKKILFKGNKKRSSSK
ncbi:hypothetical protein EDEG_03193 [Edhazardia aedis USNM 41457]|uniref:Uncharacterized protein n=1 Tax=Edhazardia aedis (strain USNM 41457) TaxID=1003232 RepID=J8ZRQ7_EDHAE|nr:hypothetical protein EDEG_03193 [Edhazardia aedis USNM 41457]|eukprot:EJW02378.1 hypothetical protein EDEG_03193 [Edhazardia aedis USNM 41457]